MTITFSVGESAPAEMLALTEEWLGEAARSIALAVQELRAGRAEGGKDVLQAVRDLKAAIQLLNEERNRIEKHAKQIAGAAGAGPLDLDAARDEIGRRLACLRAASDG